jgi:hypothetical protein
VLIFSVFSVIYWSHSITVKAGIKASEKPHEMASSKKPGRIRFRGDGLGRIQLPKELSSQISWLQRSAEAVQAWLYLVSDGRFRLLSMEEVEGDEILEQIRAIVLPGTTIEPGDPSSAEPPDMAALPGKLLPVTLRGSGQSSWRFSIPPLMDVFAPSRSDTNDFVAVFSREGYWEIWYTEAFKQAALGPLPAFLRSGRE